MSDNSKEEYAFSAAFHPEDWLSAAATLKLVKRETGSNRAGEMILQRAREGLLPAWAERLKVGERTSDSVLVPREFWWARGDEGMIAEWRPGDFEAVVDGLPVKLFGVHFLRSGLARMISDPDQDRPGRADDQKLPKEELAPVRGNVGRSRSKLWEDWIVELVVYLHEKGPPEGVGVDGQDELIRAVETELYQRGLEGPQRSTVQPIIRKILPRLRSS